MPYELLTGKKGLSCSLTITPKSNRPHRPFDHNPIYNYVRSRELEGTLAQGPKPGVWFINAYRARAGWGNVPVSRFPYDASGVPWPPVEPPGLDQIAKFNRILFYQRLFCLDEIKILLCNMESVQISVPITKQWYSAPSGLIAMPKHPSEFIDMHAVQPVGYDDSTQLLLIRNSWGTKWGENGYGYLPYDYLDSHIQEVWHHSGYTSLEPNRKTRESEDVSLLTWTNEQPLLGRRIHCFEIHDNVVRERAAWTFIIESEDGLRVEDLFVRPAFRNRKFGITLGTNALSLAEYLDRPIDFLISRGDTEPPSANFKALNAFCQKLQLKVRSVTVPGLKYVAEPGQPTTVMKLDQQPMKPPMAFLPPEYC